jgi:hypothetical protein
MLSTTEFLYDSNQLSRGPAKMILIRLVLVGKRQGSSSLHKSEFKKIIPSSEG